MQAFCELNYGVTFPMFAKIDVNGENAHPLYRYLSEQAPGLLGSQAIKWNFTKILNRQERDRSQAVCTASISGGFTSGY
ncbi:hypothetical protein GCM10020331_065880 [Ectobacillus funiculus]